MPSPPLGRVESAAVVLDHGLDPSIDARDEHAHPLGTSMLDHVRERLLDDPVDRRLDLERQPLADRAGLEVDGDAGLLAEALRQALERRQEPEVVEHLRPQLDREPAHVLQGGDDQLAQCGNCLRCLLALELLEPEQDRGQRLARLIV